MNHNIRIDLICFFFINVCSCGSLMFTNNEQVKFTTLNETLLNSSTIEIMNYVQSQATTDIDVAKEFGRFHGLPFQFDQDRKDIEIKLHLKIDKKIYEYFIHGGVQSETSFFNEYFIMQSINSRSFNIFKNQNFIIKKMFKSFFYGYVSTTGIFIEFFKTTAKYKEKSDNARIINELLEKNNIDELMNFRFVLLKTIYPIEKEKNYCEDSFENDFFHWESAYSDLFLTFKRNIVVKLLVDDITGNFIISENDIYIDNNLLHVHADTMVNSNLLTIYRKMTISIDMITSKTIYFILRIIRTTGLSDITLDLTKFYIRLFGSKFNFMKEKLLLFNSLITSISQFKIYMTIKIKKFRCIFIPCTNYSLVYEVLTLDSSEYCFFDTLLNISMKIIHLIERKKKYSFVRKIAIQYVDGYVKSIPKKVYHQFLNFFNSEWMNVFNFIEIGCGNKLVYSKISNDKLSMMKNMTYLHENQDQTLLKSNLIPSAAQRNFQAKFLNGILQKNNCLFEIHYDDSIQKEFLSVENVSQEIFNLKKKQTDQFEGFQIHIRNFIRIKSMNTSSYITYYMKSNQRIEINIYHCEIECSDTFPNDVEKINFFKCRMTSSFRFKYESPINQDRHKCTLVFLNSTFDENFVLNGTVNEIDIISCPSKFKINAKYNILKIYGWFENCIIKNSKFFHLKSESKNSHFIHKTIRNCVKHFKISFLTDEFD